MDTLPDGGPLSVTLDRRGIDIGRDTYLDWTLPDADRHISGKHCEVRYRDGGYWLHDVSTNGTSINAPEGRLTEPYLIRHGDRIHIGHYIIVADLEGAGEGAPQQPPQARPGAASADPWGDIEGAAEAVSRRDFQTGSPPEYAGGRGRPVQADPTEEDISWSVGEVTPGQSDASGADDIDVDWSAPPAAPDADEEDEALELGPASRTAPPEPSPAAEPPPVAEPPPKVSRLAQQWTNSDAPAPPAPALAPQAPAQPSADWVAAFERGAGLPPGSVARARGDDALAEELGWLFNLIAGNLKTMLAAREETKSAMRSARRTMIQAMENNPLKFSPTPEDALRIMFGEKTRSYMDARQALEATFRDLTTHQLQTFTAMQQALQALIEDLDPESLAEGTASEGGLAGLVSSRRAKLWDTYVERFKAKASRHERGMIDAFMILFAEMYDRQGRG